ncbi:hypothetical protein GOP47_0004961 [Adiantum capillus-veneris]|uniref:Uncharacterized protein n=1 Tax=Adiantum capillus-veneris TaxID=13818 RepID=A0A9D4V5V7_ADICA|nr:hypothetical protein GOP47_0004961 [Adiantum capillus-veneris]
MVGTLLKIYVVNCPPHKSLIRAFNFLLSTLDSSRDRRPACRRSCVLLVVAKGSVRPAAALGFSRSLLLYSCHM